MSFDDAIAGLDGLRRRVGGTILRPQDAEYETARRGFNLTYNHYPALILIPENAQDVVAGVRYAREVGLGVAVQTTGHGLHMAADEALLIVTSQMTGVQIDVEGRRAIAEGGARWQDVLDVATPHGLGPLLGSSPTVGVVGYTLGGGIGWLGRKYGFAADSVRWVDIVTADGELRRASLSENSELFWGLRGGNGNFGIVTAMEFDLYHVPTIYGGSLHYPPEMMGEVLHFFRDWVNNLPNEMTSSLVILRVPHLPQVPEAMRGQVHVMLEAAYKGDAAEGQGWIQQWLDWNAPLDNSFREMPFSEIATISNDGVNPVPVWGSNELFRELSDDALDVILQYVSNPDSPMNRAEIRHAGGAIGDVPTDTNVIEVRDPRFYLNMGGLVPTSDALGSMKTYVAEFRSALEPYRFGAGYLNFMAGSDAQQRVKEAFSPEGYARLVALKAAYDPDNLFRYSYGLVDSE